MYIVGLVIGKGLHWVARYKLGTKITTTVAVALVIGFAISSAPDFIGMIGQEATAGESVRELSSMLMMRILGVAIFTFGCLSPFLRRA